MHTRAHGRAHGANVRHICHGVTGSLFLRFSKKLTVTESVTVVTDRAKSRARQLAENYAAKVGEQWDAEEDALRAEFAGLDLTDAEMADLDAAWRLRGRRATKSDLAHSRLLFQQVRASLQAALKATVEFETGRDRAVRAVAVFDRDEAARVQRIVIALARPQSNEDVARLNCQLAELEATRDDRRLAAAYAAETGDLEPITALSGNSDALRHHGRDGLARLHDLGKLTLRQALAGYAYRRRWEAANRGLRSALAAFGNTTSRKLTSNDRAVTWSLQLSDCDEAIMMRLRQHPKALMILRRVAGDGFAMTAVVGNGRAHEAGVDVLKEALDVVASVLPYEAF